MGSEVDATQCHRGNAADYVFSVHFRAVTGEDFAFFDGENCGANENDLFDM